MTMNPILPAEVLVLTTGGTMDKVYFDAKSAFEVGHSIVGSLLTQAHVTAPFQISEVMRKDSLEMDDADRAIVRARVQSAAQQRIVITHGTDTMAVTANALAGIDGKTIVLTGSLAPARFADTDAMFNLGMAFAAAQVLPFGVYIAMNGRVFDGTRVRKDLDRNEFIDI